MTERPTRATPGGRAYLDLRKAASSARRPIDEPLQLYALEGFLDRLSGSPHAGRFVLKGGVLLAAFDARRPTRDVDFAAIDVTNDLGVDITGESLNEYVVRHAIEAAHNDLADRRVFVIDDAAWVELQALLSRPPTYKPESAKLFGNPSVLEER